MVRLDFKKEPETSEPVNSSNFSTLKPRKKLSFKFSCCTSLIIILIFFLIVGLAVLAKTGIVNIPLFSKIFYQPFQPIRLIKINLREPVNFSSSIKLNSQEKTAQLEISEAQLSNLINEGLRQQKEISLTNLQAVITNDLIELSAKIIRPLKTDIIFDIKPELADSQINLKIIKVQLGNLTLPPFFLDKIFSGFLGVSLNDLNNSFKSFGQLKDLQIKEGKLLLLFNI